MGDIIFFPPRAPRGLDAETKKLIDRTLTAIEREAQRRLRIYGSGEVFPAAELLRILALYPELRLTHSKNARRCLYCNHRIAPGELHFVHQGSYVCQSGTCGIRDIR